MPLESSVQASKRHSYNSLEFYASMELIRAPSMREITAQELVGECALMVNGSRARVSPLNAR